MPRSHVDRTCTTLAPILRYKAPGRSALEETNVLERRELVEPS